MKIFTKQWLRWEIPGLLILCIGLFRCFPLWSEVYSSVCYPVVAFVLSGFSALFSFSVGDCFIVGACLWIVVFPFYAWFKKKKRAGYILGKMVRFLMWIYIWFYFAWGINYFRLPFYERTGVNKAEYSEDEFKNFLSGYVRDLNEFYTRAGDTSVVWYAEPYIKSGFMDSLSVARNVRERYSDIYLQFGLAIPDGHLRVKPMLWSRGMSRVAVTGYMGPFFSEFNLNRDLLSVEYPFTYAHELAHRLGIAEEAEANLYAFLVTSGSSVPEIRFSGYFSLFGYVMNNARRLLGEEDYREVLQQVRPEIIELYRKHLIYWRGKYVPKAGQIQSKVYNAYLKSNKVSSGTKNYSEVIGLLMSLNRETMN